MKKTKKKKKPSVSCLKRKCDKLWSELIQIRAGHKCEICGQAGQLNSHHIVGRVVHALRFSVENGIALCTACHKFGRERSVHENPIRFIYWLEAQHGKYHLKQLDELSNFQVEKANYTLILEGLTTLKDLYSQPPLTVRN